MHMPASVFYTTLIIGAITTITMSVLLGGKFAPLRLWRKLFVAMSIVPCAVAGSVFSIAVTSTVFAHEGWPSSDPQLLVPTSRYLYWMYTLEVIFVAVIISCLILAMARSERKPGLYLRR